MALQGNIETFALSDVLQLLSSTKKTGRLRLEGDRGEGHLWLAEGALVAGKDGATDTGPVDALVSLLRFSEGDFEFDQDELHASPGDPVGVEEALSTAGDLVAEWTALEERIPSADAWVSLVEELPGGEVTLDSDRWRSIVAVAGGARVHEVGSRLELGDLDNMRTINALLDLGVVEVAAEAPAGVPASAPSAPGASDPTFVSEPEPAPAPEPEPFAAEEPEPSGLSIDDEAPAGMPVFDYPTDATDSVLPGASLEGDAGPLISFDPIAPEEPGLSLVEDSADVFDPAGLVIEDRPVTEPAGDLPADAPADDEDPPDAAEIARQLASLSPKAAKAVAAAAKASTEEEREEALRSLDDEETSLNRELLLKFLGSVNN